MLPQALPRQLSQATGPSHLFLMCSSLPLARLQVPQTLPQALARQLFSYSYSPQPSVFKGVQACRLPALKCFRRPCQGNSPSYRPQPSVFKGIQGGRLPALTCFRRPCQGNSPSYRPQPSVFKGRSSLPFARLQMPQTLPQDFVRQLNPATGPSPMTVLIRWD